MAEKGNVPGGTKNNFAHVENDIDFPDAMDQIDRWILCDAVTSGGLLISVEATQSEELLQKLIHAGVEASLIGEVTELHAGRIVIEG
ncbi:Selenide, water dikinase [compost metagenome]